MDTETLKKLIGRRHPKYEDNLEHWEFLDSTYEGGRAWFETNIFRYFKEGDGEFADRVKRAYRFNHTREVVDIVNKHLFRTEIVRSDDAPDCLKKFWKRATRLGVSMNDFAKVISQRSSIEGMPWVFVDNTYRPEEVVSKDDQEKAKGRVFAQLIQAPDALDWAFDEDDGELLWFLFREEYRHDDDPFESDGKVTYRYKLLTREKWWTITESKWDASGKATEYTVKDGDLAIGEVPVVPVPNSFSGDPYYVPSLVADVAYLDRSVANYASNLDAIIQDQTFSQLALPAQGILAGETGESQMIKAARNRVFLYDGESGAKPHFLSPDPRQAQLIIEAIRQLINEIYHSVGLAGERTKQDNSKGIDNSSGVAKSKDFERVIALLTAKSQSLAYAENRIARLVCLWEGEKPPEDDMVTYSPDFQVRDLWDELEIAMTTSLLSLPKEVLDEQKKTLIERLFPGMQKSRVKQLITLLEEYDPEAQETGADGELAEGPAQRIVEEAKRNRERAGDRQSATKGRETVPQ